MSSKQNKAKARKQRKQETIELEKELLKSTFPLECEALPFEELTKNEQTVVNKCLHYEELTDSEFELLKKVLVTYRSSIKKHNPKKTIDEAQKVINIINTEQELLDILDSDSMKKLLVHLPIRDKIYSMDFEILPITDSKAVQSIELQLDLFKDFTEYEKQVYSKAQGGKVSREEQQIVNRMNQELNKKAEESQDNIIITFLASQLRLPNSTDNLSKRREFWTRFPFNAKVSVFMQIQDILGLTEHKDEELFPSL